MLLCAVGVLLNIAVNERVVEARVRDRGRGTAGHVRPALAVGEALRERGVTVTFAGTSDGVQSRLVPEAGFPLDAFPVTGLPRRPSAAQLRAAWRASAALFHCLRILARRRPHVVLGAGGFVAGPMVLAARLRRIPAALTEADAHLGLWRRLAAPFARRLFLAFDIPAVEAPRHGWSAGRSRRPTSTSRARRDARRSASRPQAPVVEGFGAWAGARSLNELAVEAWGGDGPDALGHHGRARRRRASFHGSSVRVTRCLRDCPLRRRARGG